jgi:hypothetical protein
VQSDQWHRVLPGATFVSESIPPVRAVLIAPTFRAP